MKKRRLDGFSITLMTVLAGSLGLLAVSFFLPAGFPTTEYSIADYAAPAAVSQDTPTEEPPVASHLPTPEPVRALYMSSWTASAPSLREALTRLAEETEINALVIDVKDYTGRISFEVSDPLLQAIGASDGRIADLRSFIGELHSRKIYVIGRIAVFQDPFLAAKRPDLAVKRLSDGAVWQDFKGITWLDPAAREVWDYTIAISREAHRVGFDELNFDYIRFPSDGRMSDIAYPFFDDDRQTKSQVIGEFFSYLSERLKDLAVPLSADLFGMTTTNTDDLNIGQVLEDAAAYFDYLAPMVYPSHYPPGFLNFKNPAAAPYEVIRHSLAEAARRLTAASSTPQKLRPWLQDFHLGASYTAEMVRREKQAVYDLGLTSWMLWSPANRYTRGALDN